MSDEPRWLWLAPKPEARMSGDRRPVYVETLDRENYWLGRENPYAGAKRYRKDTWMEVSEEEARELIAQINTSKPTKSPRSVSYKVPTSQVMYECKSCGSRFGSLEPYQDPDYCMHHQPKGFKKRPVCDHLIAVKPPARCERCYERLGSWQKRSIATGKPSSKKG